jgi:hypothetical protein
MALFASSPSQNRANRGNMQALIHQASLYGLTMSISGSGIGPGQTVELEVTADREIAVVVTFPSILPFGLGRSRRRCLGYLSPEVVDLLMPALEREAVLRVRIVEVEPAHVRADGVDRVSISVWGEPHDLVETSRPVISFRRAGSDVARR